MAPEKKLFGPFDLSQQSAWLRACRAFAHKQEDPIDSGKLASLFSESISEGYQPAEFPFRGQGSEIEDLEAIQKDLQENAMPPRACRWVQFGLATLQVKK